MTIEDDLRAHFAYCPITGDITFAESKRSDVPVGRSAVKKSGRGYGRVSFRHRYYSAHRLAWLLQTGEWPALHIDHANMDKTDNRWINLRSATPSQNNANWGPRRQGRKGVTLHKCGQYQAQIRCNGKYHYLGLFSSEEEAGAVYAAKARELFGEFARAA